MSENTTYQNVKLNPMDWHIGLTPTQISVKSVRRSDGRTVTKTVDFKDTGVSDATANMWLLLEELASTLLMPFDTVTMPDGRMYMALVLFPHPEA